MINSRKNRRVATVNVNHLASTNTATASTSKSTVKSPPSHSTATQPSGLLRPAFDGPHLVQVDDLALLQNVCNVSDLKTKRHTHEGIGFFFFLGTIKKVRFLIFVILVTNICTKFRP